MMKAVTNRQQRQGCSSGFDGGDSGDGGGDDGGDSGNGGGDDGGDNDAATTTITAVTSVATQQQRWAQTQTRIN